MDNYRLVGIEHFVYYSIIPNTNSVMVSSFPQLSAALWPRIGLQFIYVTDYPGDSGPMDPAEVLNSRTLPVNLKGSHLASVIS